MRNPQTGFTLIELVVVITILGILAAFALPRFAELQVQARIAKMNGALASLRSGAVLAHAVQLTQGLGAGAAVSLEGASVNMANGYPQATLGAIGVAAGLVDPATGTANSGYVVDDHAGAGPVTVSPDAGHAACAVIYTAAAANAAPTYNNAGLTAANCQ